MGNIKLKAKHNVSMALKDRWLEIKAGDILYGSLCNDIISIIIGEGDDKELVLFKYSDVSDNFYISIMKNGVIL